MTRINVIPPKDLHNRHLVAEYKEFTQFLHIIRKREQFNDLPEAYTLNGGHCKFFFDKGKYMIDRFQSIAEEMVSRGIRLDVEKFEERAKVLKDTYQGKPNIMNDYIPTEEAIAINKERIALRIAEKPHLYEKKQYLS